MVLVFALSVAPTSEFGLKSTFHKNLDVSIPVIKPLIKCFYYYSKILGCLYFGSLLYILICFYISVQATGEIVNFMKRGKGNKKPGFKREMWHEIKKQTETKKK